jgi:hypothetical protein
MLPVNMRVTVKLAAPLLCVLGTAALQAADLSPTPLLSRSMHLDLDAARLRDRLAASMRPPLYRSGITISLTEKLDLATGIRNPGDTASPERLQFVTGLLWRF